VNKLQLEIMLTAMGNTRLWDRWHVINALNGG